MNKIPVWFFITAGIALLWNLLGAAAVIMNFMITPEQIATMSPDQQQLYIDTPKWSSYFSLLAVAAGSLGCLALLLRKAWALWAFVLSLLGLIGQNIGIFLLTNAVNVMGVTIVATQSFVFIIAIGLLFLSKSAIKKQWLG